MLCKNYLTANSLCSILLKTLLKNLCVLCASACRAVALGKNGGEKLHTLNQNKYKINLISHFNLEKSIKSINIALIQLQ